MRRERAASGVVGCFSTSALPWTSVRFTATHVVFTYVFQSSDKQLIVHRRRGQFELEPCDPALTAGRRWPRAGCRIATHRVGRRRRRCTAHCPEYWTAPATQVYIAAGNTNRISWPGHRGHLLKYVADTADECVCGRSLASDSWGDILKIIYLWFEKSQRSVTHDFLRYINILTHLLNLTANIASNFQHIFIFPDNGDGGCFVCPPPNTPQFWKPLFGEICRGRLK